jgi:hypothetical protein
MKHESFGNFFCRGLAVLGTLSIGGHLGCVGGCINSSSTFHEGDSFVGDLDEIRLWRKALRPQDIAAQWKSFDIKVRGNRMSHEGEEEMAAFP